MKESKRIFIGVFSLILLLTGCVSTPTWKYTSIYHYEEYFSESNKYRASRDRYYIFEDEITINELIVKDLKRYQFIGFLLPVDQQEKVELTFSDENNCEKKVIGFEAKADLYNPESDQIIFFSLNDDYWYKNEKGESVIKKGIYNFEDIDQVIFMKKMRNEYGNNFLYFDDSPAFFYNKKYEVNQVILITRNMDITSFGDNNVVIIEAMLRAANNAFWYQIIAQYNDENLIVNSYKQDYQNNLYGQNYVGKYQLKNVLLQCIGYKDVQLINGGVKNYPVFKLLSCN